MVGSTNLFDLNKDIHIPAADMRPHTYVYRMMSTLKIDNIPFEYTRVYGILVNEIRKHIDGRKHFSLQKDNMCHIFNALMGSLPQYFLLHSEAVQALWYARCVIYSVHKYRLRPAMKKAAQEAKKEGKVFIVRKGPRAVDNVACVAPNNGIVDSSDNDELSVFAVSAPRANAGSFDGPDEPLEVLIMPQLSAPLALVSQPGRTLREYIAVHDPPLLAAHDHLAAHGYLDEVKIKNLASSSTDLQDTVVGYMTGKSDDLDSWMVMDLALRHNG
ncbi:hypothetical protein BJ165DRAFT_1400851 [Panaeolus papilionaceus]|nr:hypothetical protein BJ165DRAFT_1400851 [Panaeolus papilionaceus]